MDDYDNDYMCNNCQGSGYFDMPDGSEKACSVCGGAGGVDQKDVDALRARAEAAEAKASMSWSEVERLDVELATAEAKIDRLSCWIVEADAAFNTDNKPAESLDDCLGLVRMCHEGAAALHEVQKQQAEIERLRASVSLLRGVLRRMDWLEAGDEVSGSDVAAIKAALEATQ